MLGGTETQEKSPEIISSQVISEHVKSSLHSLVTYQQWHHPNVRCGALGRITETSRYPFVGNLSCVGNIACSEQRADRDGDADEPPSR